MHRHLDLDVRETVTVPLYTSSPFENAANVELITPVSMAAVMPSLQKQLQMTSFVPKTPTYDSFPAFEFNTSFTYLGSAASAPLSRRPMNLTSHSSPSHNDVDSSPKTSDDSAYNNLAVCRHGRKDLHDCRVKTAMTSLRERSMEQGQAQENMGAGPRRRAYEAPVHMR